MRFRRDMPQDGVRRNEMIRAREVRVIAADGEQLGILQRNEAIALAKEAGMDLVEVLPDKDVAGITALAGASVVFAFLAAQAAFRGAQPRTAD